MYRITSSQGRLINVQSILDEIAENTNFKMLSYIMVYANKIYGMLATREKMTQ